MDFAQPDQSDQQPTKRRSWGLRLFLWGGIGLLVLASLLEAASCRMYQASLTGLQQAVAANKHAGQKEGLPASDIEKYVQGLAFRSEAQLPLKQPVDEKRRAKVPVRKVVYHWPSLYTRYGLVVTLNDQDRILLVGQDESAENPGPKPAAGAETSGASIPRALPKEGLAAAPDQTLVLATDEPSILNTMRKKRLGSLARELFRQAVLIAARDELGLSTLDATLGEVTLVTNSPKAFPVHVDVTLQPGDQGPTDARFVVQLSRPEVSGAWFKWSSSPTPISVDPGLNGLMEQVEPLSRGELVEGLKAAGFQQSSPQTVEMPPVPDEFPSRLDFVAQYAVLRQLHARRHAQGETVDNLGALVRAYANLGNLIDFHWSPMSKAFKARALIYAQRMQAKYGKTSSTLAHRAYAWTMVGNYVFALQDVKAARALPSDEPPEEWLDLIEAFCEYRPKTLQEHQGAWQEFSRYLRMRLFSPYYEQSSTISAIERGVKKERCLQPRDRTHARDAFARPDPNGRRRVGR